MLVEISVVQSFTLLLGYPTYSLTVTLFSMLVFAAIGSALTSKIPEGPRPRWIVAAVLGVLLVTHLLLGSTIQRALLHNSLVTRAFVAVALLAPLGVALGSFLPLGMRELARDNPRGIPLAWAANGTFSVVGTTSATLLATLVGFDRVLLVALCCYAVAAGAIAWRQRSGQNVRAPAT
jgi:hypothetical protein